MTASQILLVEEIKQQVTQNWHHYPPASLQRINETEAALGFHLPELLKELYLQVANGGFGPRYKITGLAGGALDDVYQQTLVAVYQNYSSPSPKRSRNRWPEQLAPFCDWGCLIKSCLDCTKPEAPVILYDPNKRTWKASFQLEAASFEEWLEEYFIKGERKPQK